MKRTIFLAIIILSSLSNVQAQKLKDYIKKKKQVVERELDRKTDQKIREGVDNLFKKNKNSDNSNDQGSNTQNNNLATGTTENITTVYSFGLSIDYDFSSVGAKKQDDAEGEFVMMMSNENYTGVQLEEEGQKVVSIMDEQHDRSLVIMKSTKMAFVSNFNEAQQTNSSNSNEGTTTSEHSTNSSHSTTGGTGGTTTKTAKQSFKKTGKQEVIAGYKCDHYTWADDEVKGEVWIAHDLKDFDLRKSFGNSPNKFKVEVPKDAPQSGVVLKYIGKHSDGTTVELKAKKVSKKTTTYDMSKYKVFKGM